MKKTENNKRELAIIPDDKNKKGIENHKKAATHFKAAATHHLRAAKHHEAGNHKQAAQSTIIAQGHVGIAKEAQKTDAKQHALQG